MEIFELGDSHCLYAWKVKGMLMHDAAHLANDWVYSRTTFIINQNRSGHQYFMYSKNLDKIRWCTKQEDDVLKANGF